MIEKISVCVVGYGNMGRALVDGWLRAGLPAEQIVVADTNSASLSAARETGVRVATEAKLDKRFDVCLIAVKPQHLSAAATDNAAMIAQSAVVLSIAAGITLATLTQLIGKDRAIVRAMPNTPAAIGRGVTVLCGNDSVASIARDQCSLLIDAVGATHWIDDESLFDAVTALSGSGPAYIFLFIECLRDAGIAQGLSAELASNLAIQTVTGAWLYAEHAQATVEQLRRQVTSPGGTTEAALKVLTNDNVLADLINAAVSAAAARSHELGEN